MRQELQSPEGKWKWMIHPPTPRLWPSRSLYYCSRGDARETRLYLTGWKVRKCCLGVLKTPLSNFLHSNSAVNFLRFPRKTFPWRLAFRAGKMIFIIQQKGPKQPQPVAKTRTCCNFDSCSCPKGLHHSCCHGCSWRDLLDRFQILGQVWIINTPKHVNTGPTFKIAVIPL